MIIPAILENSATEVQRKVSLIKDVVERVQVDVVDGIFTDNFTVSPVDLLGLDFFDLGVDIHLMTEEPVDLIAECANLGGKVKDLRIIGQIERMSNQTEFVSLAKKMNLEVGLGLDLYTPVEAVRTCRQAGATSFAVGSWLWQHRDISLAIKELNKI